MLLKLPRLLLLMLRIFSVDLYFIMEIYDFIQCSKDLFDVIDLASSLNLKQKTGLFPMHFSCLLHFKFPASIVKLMKFSCKMERHFKTSPKG